MKIHPDEASELTQAILEPFFSDRSMMYQMFRALRTSDRLDQMDRSWVEPGAFDSTGDVEGAIEYAVQQYVYNLLTQFEIDQRPE